MIRQLIITVGCAVAVMLVMAPLASAVQMTCSGQAESFLSSAAAPPNPIRTDCVMAQSPDGQAFPVQVKNAKIGDKLTCTVKEGKAACANVGGAPSAD
jgi:hypothetical protein